MNLKNQVTQGEIAKMAAVHIGVLGGIIVALLIVVWATFKTGVDELGWRPVAIIKGSWPCFKDPKLVKVTLELMWWCGLHGLLFGMLASDGGLKFAGAAAVVLYLILACTYRYVIGKRQGVSYHPRPLWKQFWAVRGAVDELNKVDKKAYNTFYSISLGVCLFWYWIGLFDFAN